MAPITRAKNSAELEEQLRLVTSERDLLRAERDTAQGLVEQCQTLLDETRTERDEVKTELDGMRLAYEKLLQEKQSMASQIETLTLQVQQCGQIPGQPRLHINSLPEVPLQRIFSFLPPKDVLQMARVCLAWKSLQQRVLSKVRSTSLLLGRPVNNMYITDAFDYFINPRVARLVKDEGSNIYPKKRFGDEWFQVCCSSLTMDNVVFLATSLPNIVTLKITINKVSFNVLDRVIQLLKMLSTKLVTLKLWCCFSEENRPMLRNKLAQLLGAINPLKQLTHLTVVIDNKLFRETGAEGGRIVDDQFVCAVTHFELPILARLKQFNFRFKDRNVLTPLLYSLKHFVPHNPMLTHIGIGKDDIRSLEMFADKCPTVASRITSIYSIILDSPMQTTLSKYESLTVVGYVNIAERLNFTEVINSLSSLKHLIRLGLYLRPEAAAAARSRLYPLSNEDATPCHQISQLASVKALTVLVNGNKMSDFQSRHWAWAFPNLKLLELVLFTKSTLIPEMRQLVQSFVQCPVLRHIFVIDYDRPTEWALVESDGRRTFREVLM